MSDKTPERLALEARAKDLKVKFSKSIGDDTLKERVDAAEAQAKTPAPKQTPAPTQDPEKSGTARIEVTGPKGGFWRAGLKFTDVPRVFYEGDLTKEQVIAINDEPELKIKFATGDDEE